MLELTYEERLHPEGRSRSSPSLLPSSELPDVVDPRVDREADSDQDEHELSDPPQPADRRDQGEDHHDLHDHLELATPDSSDHPATGPQAQCHHELADEDDSSRQPQKWLMDAEREERAGDEELVGERIEDLAELRYLIPPAR